MTQQTRNCHIQVCYTCGKVTLAKHKHITRPYLYNDWIWLCDECEELRKKILNTHIGMMGDEIQYLRTIIGVK